MIRDEMWKVGNGWIWQKGRREKRVRQSKRQKEIRSRGRRGAIET